MHNIKILEYNIAILDEDEVKLYDETYDKLMMKAFKDVENIIFELDDGSKVPGDYVYRQAKDFFNIINNNHFSSYQLLGLVNYLITALTAFEKKNGNFFDYSFTKARILMEMSNIITQELSIEKENILRYPDKLLLQSLMNFMDYRERTINQYTKVIELFQDSFNYFNETNKDFNNSLAAEGTYILSYLVEAYYRKIMCIISTYPLINFDSGRFWDSVKIAVELQSKQSEIFEKLFNEQPFYNENFAATMLVNYADSLKYSSDRNKFKRGIAIYKEAAKYLDDSSSIDERIEHYEKLESQFTNDINAILSSIFIN